VSIARHAGDGHVRRSRRSVGTVRAMGRPRVRTDELRARLLDGALRLVADGGPAAVTTRAVAATAGSSVAAVDELFGGKVGLVRAMFVEGFERLAATVAALPEPADAEAGILDMAVAFRRFALEHRQLFDVMFSRPYAEFEPVAADLVGYHETGRVIGRRIDALLGPAVPAAARKDAALALTATLHGLARMELAGILGSGPVSIARRWRTTVLATTRGLVAASAPDGLPARSGRPA
jgi:AcrR family transcriptional regulator